MNNSLRTGDVSVRPEDDGFEALLQQAFEPIATAQPTPEFEQRLLATSRTAHVSTMPVAPRVGASRWRLVAGLAAAAALLVTVATYEFSHHEKAIAKDAAVTLQPPTATTLAHADSLALQQKPTVSAAEHSTRQTRALVTSVEEAHTELAAEEVLPKLDTFPSPDPVSMAVVHRRSNPILHGAAAEALLKTEQQQNEPIVIAEIHITALSHEEKETPQ